MLIHPVLTENHRKWPMDEDDGAEPRKSTNKISRNPLFLIIFLIIFLIFIILLIISVIIIYFVNSPLSAFVHYRT